MNSRERVVTVRKGTLKDNDRLNDEFWAEIPPHERLAAMWDMVREYSAWRGPDASESRLQRSVLRVERR